MARSDPEPADGGADRRAPRRCLRWTERKRKIFVRVLAESYDTSAALAAADLSWPEVCELRVRYPDFAARIDEVIVAGFDRLEASFLRLAMAALAAEKPDMGLVQAVMKLRRPARTAAAPMKRSHRDQAERERLIQSIMGKIAPLRAAQAGESGDGRNGAGRDCADGVGRH